MGGTNPPGKEGTVSPKAQLALEEDAVYGQGKLELKWSQCMPSSGHKELSSSTSALVNDHHALSSLKIKLT